ncbi:MAG: HNH endonuclease [Candidatus Aenigmarchaeota archaeon]|nr:HNH endonuclease [Candidatus Aenigmarchaeota archaeon]
MMILQIEEDFLKTGTKWRRLKQDILRRDGNKCQICDCVGTEIDHIFPVYAGGDEWNPKNLQTLCKSCHKEKTTLDKRKYGGKQVSLICVCGHKASEHSLNLIFGRRTNRGRCGHEDLNRFSNFGDIRDLIECSCEKFNYSFLQMRG